MKIDNTLRLLVFCASQNDAEDLISHFRNNGYPTRAHRVSSSEQLPPLLSEDTWDLLICDASLPENSWQSAITMAKPQNVPSIILQSTEQSIATKAFSLGASDCIVGDHLEHLLHAALREISSRRALLEKDALQTAHEELQARYELLMDGSEDAIAYLTDGMHVDANEAYASQFGYEDCDELACVPVIDLIAPSEQERFKRFLRDYSKHSSDHSNQKLTEQQGQDGVELDTAISLLDGSTKKVCMQFAPANYEGEQCTQVIILAERITAESTSPAFATAAQHWLEGNGQRAEQFIIAYLHLENLTALRTDVGIIGAEFVCHQLLRHVQNGVSCDDGSPADSPRCAIVGAISSDGFGLLYDSADLPGVLTSLEQIITSARQHMIETGGRSVQGELSAVALALPAETHSVESSIDQAFQALVDQLEAGDSQFAISYSPPAAPINLDHGDIDLDKLYAQGRLQLYYQPAVSLRGEPGDHYEVSCTINNAGGEAVDRQTIAETLLSKDNTSLFDRWMLLSALQAAQLKCEAGSDTRVIVNLSPCSLNDTELPSWLAINLKACGLSPANLIIQLTQHQVSIAVKQAQRMFKALSDIGCRSSISEFGGDAGSTDILQHVTPQLIKIDETQVLKAQSEANGKEYLATSIMEANKAGASTVIPAVCNAATLASLWQLGAGFIQGDYVQQPATSMEYEFAEIA